MFFLPIIINKSIRLCGGMTVFTLYDIYEDFVVSCTLSVNTSACLSRRRVGTGVFTNQTYAVNRNRNKSFMMAELKNKK